MNDKKFIVIVWGAEGLTNEIGFVNFWKTCTVAISINPDSYIGWYSRTETACIVIPIEKGIGKAIDALMELNPITDIRIMPEVMVDVDILEVSDEA